MGRIDWIAVAQGRDSWRALVNAVMNLGVQLNTGISLIAEDLLASQK
jgi:hypothetical protein